jgi:aldehyde:ferredoxin oxidoreductase
MYGYVGKIIRLNLTNKTIDFIQTSDYEQWGGGHGIGSAIFFDLAVIEKGLDLESMDHNSPHDGGFHPDNVVTIMTSPLTGTLVPGASGRTEVQGIGVMSYPVGWFTRSNFGGRFGAMLKFAGYDGIVIEGVSDTPVWVDIRDESILIRECSSLGLWGMDTKACQETIWDYVAESSTDNKEYGKWISPEGTNDSTTQRPAVLTIGIAGENKSRIACLIHDVSNAAGQGGFGGIWGSKNLKAISVIGSGRIYVADPQKLLEARINQMKHYGFNEKNAKPRKTYFGRFSIPPVPVELYSGEFNGSIMATKRNEEKRPQACVGCSAACRSRYKSGKANEANCAATMFYSDANTREIQYDAIDLLNRYGLNAYELQASIKYLKELFDLGVIGSSGSEIETSLNFDDYGSLHFVESFLDTLSTRNTDFGDTLAEGIRRAIEIWGRTSDIGDVTDGPGKIQLPYWGFAEHGYDPRSEVEWGYGSILGDRDCNEHCFNSIFWDALNMFNPIKNHEATAEETVRIFAEKMIPYKDDYASAEESQQMLDFADENMYSEHIARLVAWHRHYTRFFKQSLLFCDHRWPDIVNGYRDDKVGSTGEAEPKFFNAVTGKTITFLDGMELGRKIWNLDNAIWVLQGRNRDMVHFADYVYNKDTSAICIFTTYNPTPLPLLPQWGYRSISNRRIKKGTYPNGDNSGEDFESFKTRFYNLEGWDASTGWPTRSTLEAPGIDLGYVADVLEDKGHLGI